MVNGFLMVNPSGREVVMSEKAIISHVQCRTLVGFRPQRVYNWDFLKEIGANFQTGGRLEAAQSFFEAHDALMEMTENAIRLRQETTYRDPDPDKPEPGAIEPKPKMTSAKG